MIYCALNLFHCTTVASNVSLLMVHHNFIFQSVCRIGKTSWKQTNILDKTHADADTYNGHILNIIHMNIVTNMKSLLFNCYYSEFNF